MVPVPVAPFVFLVCVALEARAKLVALASENQELRDRLYYVENLLLELDRRQIVVERELANSFIDEEA